MYVFKPRRVAPAPAPLNMNVTNDIAASMDLKLRPNHDPDGKPVLEWTSGTEQSTMLCDFLYERDNTPVNWVFPPGAQPDTPPAVAEATPEDTSPQPDVKTITQPTITSGLTIALSTDSVGGHTVDVTLGTSTPTTMLIDTGATIVSLPQNIADQLVSIGDATLVDKGQFTIADGTTHIKNIIDIGKFTIGGRTLYHVRASVAPDGAEPLLGTNVLNIFGKFSIDAANNQLILG